MNFSRFSRMRKKANWGQRDAFLVRPFREKPSKSPEKTASLVYLVYLVSQYVSQALHHPRQTVEGHV
jgi:hypothetical protein